VAWLDSTRAPQETGRTSEPVEGRPDPGSRIAAGLHPETREERLVPKRLFVVAVTAVAACAVASAGVAGSTQVDHFTDGPFPDMLCGVSGTSSVHGTSVLRETAKGVFFAGTFSQVFVAGNGSSVTLTSNTPNKESNPVVDEQAGTVTVRTTFHGLPVKVSITGGPTLVRDAGIGTFVDVFEYTGDPDNPVGDHISSDVVGVHGPHPVVLGDKDICAVVGPYLLGQ